MKYSEDIRYAYDLNEDSIVFDIGAYTGVFIEGIFNRYHCNIYAYEPMRSFFEKAKEKFDNSKIRLFNYGLLDKDSEVEMKDYGVSSSLFNDNEGGEKVIMKDILKVVKDIKIDLIKINIEGGEYDLLKHILDNGDITIFKNIQIQYHISKHDRRQNCYSNAKELIQEITNELYKTHNLKWWFPVWESWEIK